MRQSLLIFLLIYSIQSSAQSFFIGTNALFGTNIHPLKMESLNNNLGLSSLNSYAGGGLELGYHFKEKRLGFSLGLDWAGNSVSNDSIGSDLRIYRIPILMCVILENAKYQKIILSGGISFNQIRYEYYSLDKLDIDYLELKALPNTKYLNFINNSLSLMLSLAYPFMDQFSIVARYQHSLYKSLWQSSFIQPTSLSSDKLRSVELCIRYSLIANKH